jgi:hypothetical protein
MGCLKGETMNWENPKKMSKGSPQIRKSQIVMQHRETALVETYLLFVVCKNAHESITQR